MAVVQTPGCALIDLFYILEKMPWQSRGEAKNSQCGGMRAEPPAAGGH